MKAFDVQDESLMKTIHNVAKGRHSLGSYYCGEGNHIRSRCLKLKRNLSRGRLVGYEQSSTKMKRRWLEIL